MKKLLKKMVKWFLNLFRTKEQIEDIKYFKEVRQWNETRERFYNEYLAHYHKKLLKNDKKKYAKVPTILP